MRPALTSMLFLFHDCPMRRKTVFLPSNVSPTCYIVCDTKENLWHAYNLDIVPYDIRHGQNIALRLDKEGSVIEMRVLPS